jgi:hypothetical protein
MATIHGETNELKPRWRRRTDVAVEREARGWALLRALRVDHAQAGAREGVGSLFDDSARHAFALESKAKSGSLLLQRVDDSARERELEAERTQGGIGIVLEHARRRIDAERNDAADLSETARSEVGENLDTRIERGDDLHGLILVRVDQELPGKENAGVGIHDRNDAAVDDSWRRSPDDPRIGCANAAGVDAALAEGGDGTREECVRCDSDSLVVPALVDVRNVDEIDASYAIDDEHVVRTGNHACRYRTLRQPDDVREIGCSEPAGRLGSVDDEEAVLVRRDEQVVADDLGSRD